MEPMVLDKREITKGECVLEDLLYETIGNVIVEILGKIGIDERKLRGKIYQKVSLIFRVC